MSYRIRFSSKKAKCVDCKAKIDGFDPRIDHERDDDLPEGEKGSGFRTRRFCLKCGHKRIKDDLAELVQLDVIATNAHNMVAARMGKKRKSRPEPPKAKTVTCDVDKCGAKAAELFRDTKSGRLFVCEKGHFWVE